LAEYTKGVWRLETKQTSSGHSDYQVISAQVGKSVFIADCGEGEIGAANADLICATVNACADLNPDNPMVVSESIKDLYYSMRELLKLLESKKVANFLNSNALGWSLEFERAQRAINKAQGK
jgi:hypothetical protein